MRGRLRDTRYKELSALGVVVLTLFVLSLSSLAAQDWCADVESMATAGVPDEIIAQTLQAASPALPIKTVACIASLEVSDAVKASAAQLQESDAQRATREQSTKVEELALSPRELASLQNAWLTKHVDTMEKGKWSVEVSYDKMYDMNTVVASVGSGDQIQGWLEVEKEPRLVVRCKRGHVDVFVQTGMPSARSPLTGSPMALARIDDEVPKHFPLKEATTMEALFFTGGREWVSSLAGSQRFIFEFIPTKAATATIEFDVAGSSGVVEVVEKACAREPWLPPETAAP